MFKDSEANTREEKRLARKKYAERQFDNGLDGHLKLKAE
jgi:hypothetical protein